MDFQFRISIDGNMEEFEFILLIIGVVIVQLAIAFGCAAIAKSKNKSALGWFSLGVLLGIIGILIIGFMEKEEPGNPHSWKDWALAIPIVIAILIVLFILLVVRFSSLVSS